MWSYLLSQPQEREVKICGRLCLLWTTIIHTDTFIGRPHGEKNDDFDDDNSYNSQLKKLKVSELQAECKRKGIGASKHLVSSY
jgi:hypothetical protein